MSRKKKLVIALLASAAAVLATTLSPLPAAACGVITFVVAYGAFTWAQS